MPTGQDIFNKALTMKGRPYVEGTLVPKNDANWNGAWDCAELVSWAVYQVAGILYGCTNDHASPAWADAYSGSWKTDAINLGTIITKEQAAKIPGAAVLRAPAKDLGGHIVISNGRGGTIEAKGKAWGVIEDTLNGRRWDFGILVPGITYATSPDVIIANPASPVYRYTDPMMVNIKIGEIQTALTKAGFATKGIDNVFGPNTLNAVLAFQRANGLVADGEVGKLTADKLGVVL